MRMNMKHYRYILLYSLLLGISLFSCNEDQDKVMLLGGTAPVLSVSSESDLVLDKANASFSSLQFQWTNPGFVFTNGINTQDVNYILEIDTTGSNFSNLKIIKKSYPKEISASFTVKDLNNALSGLELKDYMSHPFEFRVSAIIANSSMEPLYSNVVKINITTYLDVVYPVPDKLYITGAATPKSWMGGGDPEEVSQRFTKVNSYLFVIESLDINANSGFLFVPVYGDWSNKYGFTGDASTNNPSGDTFRPNGNDFKSPATSKAYKITVNFKTGKYSFE